MELFPAIDLRHGQAVRLVQGDFGRERVYGDPLALARHYERGGARWVHVVDLDGARRGSTVHREVVLAIAASLRAQVQAGGGVRSAEDAAALLDGGVSRVVLGTATLDDPELVARLAARYPGRVAVGLDHRRAGREVAVHGWKQVRATTVATALAGLEHTAIAAVVVTAIERDGVMQGPDLTGLRHVLTATQHDVIASGGVRGVEDLRALGRLAVAERRLAGAIVGTALVEGAVGVQEAIAACAASG